MQHWSLSSSGCEISPWQIGQSSSNSEAPELPLLGCCSKLLLQSELKPEALLEAHLKSTGCQGLLSLRTCPPGARVSDRRGPVVPRVQEPVAHRQRKHHGNRLGVVAREEVRQPHPADIFCGEHEARVPGLDGAVRTTEGMQT
eukprot:CAMPEP_0206149924 /NCGR_PEP_ID=MMETSP1473-20131121/38027_1 /ASSEMBLY_ACC=CAM_ASM_001109 /TAXON_ID=1461547 /ORGANISM="Stichococcus sp, Strain RCC1054" /LENGTH=142 /DNA_ID=CAMNT_0053547409 /DNA_START=966 /DNA_END=1395 /DNA_ORIENTATION=+